MKHTRTPLILLVASALLVVTAPAKAALPSSSPTDKHRCANGKTARTWIKFGPHPIGLSRLAADNPCKTEWVLFYFHGASESDPYGLSVFVAPGQRINLDGVGLAEWGLSQWWDEEYGGASLVAPKDACVRNYDHPTGGWTGYHGLLFKSATDVRNAPECGQPIPKYSADHFAEMACPVSGGTSYLAWKTEGKKVVKVALSNGCTEDDNHMAIATWKLDNGRTVGVWAYPGQSLDIWKSEFGKLPVKTKDGRVRLTSYPYADEEDAGRSDPKNRPFYYNGFLDRDGTVSCGAGRKSC